MGMLAVIARRVTPLPTDLDLALRAGTAADPAALLLDPAQFPDGTAAHPTVTQPGSWPLATAPEPAAAAVIAVLDPATMISYTEIVTAAVEDITQLRDHIYRLRPPQPDDDPATTVRRLPLALPEDLDVNDAIAYQTTTTTVTDTGVRTGTTLDGHATLRGVTVVIRIHAPGDALDTTLPVFNTLFLAAVAKVRATP